MLFLLGMVTYLSIHSQSIQWEEQLEYFNKNYKIEAYGVAEVIANQLIGFSYSKESYATSLLAMAQVKMKFGDYQRADSLLTIAYSLHHFPDGLTFNIVHQQANLYNHQVKPELAKYRILLAGEIMRQLKKPLLLQAKLYTQVALNANELEAYELAITRLNDADSLNNINGFDTLLQVQIDYQLGESYLQKEEYELAENYLNRSLELVNQYDSLHSEKGTILNHLGRLYLRQNRVNQAFELLQKGLIIQEKRLGKGNREFAITLVNLGDVNFELGQFQEAEQFLQQAINVFEKNTGSPYWTIVAKAKLGYVLKHLGKNDLALSILQNAQKVYTQLGKYQEYLKVGNRIAEIYLDQQQIDSAEQILIKNYFVCKNRMDNESINYALVIHDLAEFYLNKGSYGEAIKYYLEAKDILAQLVGKKHPYYASIIYNLAYTHQKNGELDLAEQHYLEMEAIDRATIGEQHPDFVYSQYGMANFYALQGSPQAKDYFFGANRGQLNLIYDYYSGFDEGTRLSYLKEAQRGFDEFYSFVKDADDQQNLISEAQNLSLATKGLALDFSIANRLSNEKDTTALQKKWLAKRAELAAAYGLSQAERAEQNINLEQLKNASEQLEKDLIRSDENARLALQQCQRFTSADLQQKLAKNAVSIDIVRAKYYEPNRSTDSIFYYAILHFGDPQRSAEFVPLAEEKQLAKLLKTSDGYVKYPQIGTALSDLIWQPLMPYLNGIQDIHLAPDGWLHRVAFGALPTPAGLVDDQYNVLYYNHLRDFLQLENPNSERTIALVGGAYFDLDSTQLVQLSTAPQDLQIELDSTDLTMPLAAVSRAVADDSTRSAVQFNYLRGTQSEVENIHTLFQKKKWKTKLLMGERALEDEVKNLAEAKSPVVLHLATHGYFFDGENGDTDATLRERIINADHPLIRSGLVFTGVNHTWQGGTKIKGLEDGVLTALEISNLDLSNTDLVVLSACETGMGEVQGGEGVFGLQRAFKMAGANQLILSLWKVPDAQTYELMQLFYKEYLKSNSAATALQHAQAKMRKRYEPYYWAGFVLIN
ncbi:MAG: CHAT domain-containing protein [Saprospiraceae bacterium]